MPSRRISANESLAVVQEIAVNPYSSYNSDNVNMLTRAVTGEKNKDFVVNGLDVFGNNRVNTEVLDTELINETFPNQAAFDNNWTNTYFSYDSNTAFSQLMGTNVSQQSILSSILSPSSGDIGYWFKIEFTLTKTPKRLYVQYGSEIKIYDHPEDGSHTLYLQLYNNSNVFENLTFTVHLDSLDPTASTYIRLDNIKLTKVLNRANPIDPIALPSAELPDTYTGAHLDSSNIPEYMLHPHEALKVYPGVCIKDETIVNLLGTDPTHTEKEIITLTYNNDDSWIKGQAFQASDFTGTSYYTEDGGAATGVTFTNGILNTTLYDDGEPGGPTYYKKIVGNSSGTNPAVVQWAYVCVYYSYFKNPDPNKAFIGLVKEADLLDARYGEDFLVLAKLRFVDINTVDAIIYYPDRKDWGFIDATRVTYLHLNQLKHWIEKPLNVSLALDLLASRIYNFKGVLFFPTHQHFIQWKDSIGGDGTGTGHGPKEFLQWLQGMNWENGYDLMAYVLDTQTLWRSQIQLTGSIDTIEVVEEGSGYDTGVTSVVIDPSSAGPGSGATATANITGDKVTSISLGGAGSGYINVPKVTITNTGSGTGATVRANMSPVMTGYEWVVDWYEVKLKTFELSWAEINSSKWPTSKPTKWVWYSGYSVSEPVWTSEDPTSVQAEWPNGYYRVAGGTSYTIVNPFNIHGKGTVPGPLTEDVTKNRFLRADGVWKDAGGISSYSFFIQGYLVADTDVGEILISKDITLNTIEVAVDTLPEPTSKNIEFQIFKKTYSGGTWSDNAALVTTPNPFIIKPAVDGGVKRVRAKFPDTIFAAENILLVRCITTGDTPTEGGMDTKITVYYSE